MIYAPGKNIPMVSFDVIALSWIFHAKVIVVDVDRMICSGDIVKLDLWIFEGNNGENEEIQSWLNECSCGSDAGIINVNWIENIQ